MTQKKIDELANLWNKTKDPKYKDLWYKYIKEYINGINNMEQRDISTDPSYKKMMDGIVLTADVNCLDLCEILRLKLTGYIDTLNLHIMNDGSGDWIGCMCR